MNQESIDKMTRHVKDVHRIEADVMSLTPEELDRRLEDRRTYVSTRWALCRRAFQMLFMAVSRGNRVPLDTFEVRLSHEVFGDTEIDTYLRVWRDRRDDTFNVKPFTRNGRIESHEFDAERFGGRYDYRYGTYRSKTATFEVNRDAPDPEMEFTRQEGKLTEAELTPAQKTLFLAAIDGLIGPSIEATEDTLILVCESMLDAELNPDLADRLKVDNLPSNVRRA